MTWPRQSSDQSTSFASAKAAGEQTNPSISYQPHFNPFFAPSSSEIMSNVTTSKCKQASLHQVLALIQIRFPGTLPLNLKSMHDTTACDWLSHRSPGDLPPRKLSPRDVTTRLAHSSVLRDMSIASACISVGKNIRFGVSASASSLRSAVSSLPFLQRLHC